MPTRVLVADDESAITELVALGLEHDGGFEVLQAGDGREALDLARAERPDVILLDVMMPRLDGRQVCRHLREEDGLEATPIVLFSSADERDIDWRAAGADAFLQKPFDVLKLSEFIEEIRRRRAGRA